MINGAILQSTNSEVKLFAQSALGKKGNILAKINVGECYKEADYVCLRQIGGNESRD